MVVELVPTGVESLGVVVVHLLKANRAGVRVLQVLGQRNAREQNRRNDELESAQNLLVDERWWWLGGPLWGELDHQLANLESFFTFLLGLSSLSSKGFSKIIYHIGQLLTLSEIAGTLIPLSFPWIIRRNVLVSFF